MKTRTLAALIAHRPKPRPVKRLAPSAWAKRLSQTGVFGRHR